MTCSSSIVYNNLIVLFQGSLRKQLQGNISRNVENTQFPQPSDLNPSASDQKALLLPSFAVTQTLVNLLAEGGGTCELFYLLYFYFGTIGVSRVQAM